MARPRRVVIRGGRRGGKSANICRLAVADCTSGSWDIASGDIGIFNIFSAKREQAADRVATCAAVAEALGIRHHATQGAIVFPDYRTEIRVSVANVRSAVSGTSIGALFDEMAHWDDEGVNPATSILSQFKWSMATNPHAILWLVSAPILTTDAHAVEYDRTRADQIRFTIPTFVGNPTLDREALEREADDDVDFLRNVCAIPCDSGGGAYYPGDLVRRAMGGLPSPV